MDPNKSLQARNGRPAVAAGDLREPDDRFPVLARRLPLAGVADELYHIGTLDPADKGRVSESLEGDGLSVSVHPDEWEHIARLGGNPWWILRKRDIRLVDLHAIPAADRDAIRSWAVDNGWVVPATLWRVAWYDSERYDTVWFVFDDEAEARDEHEFRVGDERPTIAPIEGMVATQKLRERMHHSCPADLADEFAVLVFAEDVAGADGVWWQDDYDPDQLSCPRGVIFASKLAAFAREQA